MRLTAVAAVAIAIATAGMVLAATCDGSGPHGAPGAGQGRHHGMLGEGPGHGPHGPLAGMLETLDLTDEQREQLHATFARHMDGGLRAAFEAEGAARREVQRMVHDPAATDEQIVAAVRSGAGAEERLALEQRRLFEDLQGILTEEQKQELRQRHEEMQQRGALGMQRRQRSRAED